MRIRVLILSSVLAAILTACSIGPPKPALDNEKNPEYQFDKAVIALKYGLPEQALRYLEQAVALDPRCAKAYRLAGIIRLQAKEPAAAADAFGRWLEVEPGSSEGHLYLGAALQDMGETGRAEAEFRASFQADGNAPAAFRLGRLLLGKGDFNQALDFADRAILKAGQDGENHNLKGVILNQLGRFSEAAESFQAALALKPDNPAYMVNLGIAFINLGSPEKAKPWLEKALPLAKDPAFRDKILSFLKMTEGRKG
jgi:tetratricopeptide (TPR) repeat protein